MRACPYSIGGPAILQEEIFGAGCKAFLKHYVRWVYWFLFHALFLRRNFLFQQSPINKDFRGCRMEAVRKAVPKRRKGHKSSTGFLILSTNAFRKAVICCDCKGIRCLPTGGLYTVSQWYYYSWIRVERFGTLRWTSDKMTWLKP